MTARSTFKLFSFLIAFVFCRQSFAQNSILVNFGSSSCGNTVPGFSLIKDPLSATPAALTNCDMSVPFPNYFGVFIAYNPLDNKIYVADVRSGIDTKIWLMDMGLPPNITCPAIPESPTYSYNYVANNFEFDNNGNLWSLSNYNPTTGQCSIDNIDVANGTIISTRLIQFPEGNYPTTIASGDLTILPNGRMFVVLGNGTCRLYEINNYSGASNATATYLTTMPKDCYGIAYLNGLLELTGMDFGSNCYYYAYNIADNTLSAERTFQNGQSPIDNTSLTPSVGSTKQLLYYSSINANTTYLVYDLYVENMGNMILNNVNISDDLAATFGAENVSNVRLELVPGSNGAGLTLNPAYNGTTVTSMLNPGQTLPNKVLNNNDYFFKVRLRCHVSNLDGNKVYYNSGLATGEVGNGATLITVSDSTNCGDSTKIDPNKNGNPRDSGENVRTPLIIKILPVKFINVSASLINKHTAQVQWQVATPMTGAAKFEVEFSTDARTWTPLGKLPVTDAGRASWDFIHNNIPAGYIYYRVQQTDKDGRVSYSKTVLLNNKTNAAAYVIYPNPASNYISVSGSYGGSKKTVIQLYDASGRLLHTKQLLSSAEEIDTMKYPDGSYILRITDDSKTEVYKVNIKH